MLSSLLLTVPLIQSLVRQVPTLMPCGPAQAQPYGQRLGIQLLGVTLGEASEAATLTTNQSRSWEHETSQAAPPPQPPLGWYLSRARAARDKAPMSAGILQLRRCPLLLRFVD